MRGILQRCAHWIARNELLYIALLSPLLLSGRPRLVVLALPAALLAPLAARSDGGRWFPRTALDWPLALLLLMLTASLFAPHSNYVKTVMASRPESYWRLGERLGNLAQDMRYDSLDGIYIKRAAHGRYYGWQSGETRQVAGALDASYNDALHFAGGARVAMSWGPDNCFRCPEGRYWTPADQAFTISVWLQAQPGAAGTPLYIGAADDPLRALAGAPSRSVFVALRNPANLQVCVFGACGAPSGVSAADGSWHHVALTWAPAHLRSTQPQRPLPMAQLFGWASLYLDGQRVAYQRLPMVPVGGLYNFFFGGPNGKANDRWTNWYLTPESYVQQSNPNRALLLGYEPYQNVPTTYTGALDELAIYARVLTPAEVGMHLKAAHAPLELFAKVRIALDKICGVVWGVLFYYAGVRWGRQRARGPARVAAGLLAGGLALALAAPMIVDRSLDWLTKYPLLGMILMALPDLHTRVPGSPNGLQANAVAGVLAALLPVCVALLAPSLGGWRPQVRIGWKQLLDGVIVAMGAAVVAFLAWPGAGGGLGAAVVLTLVAGASTVVLFAPVRSVLRTPLLTATIIWGAILAAVVAVALAVSITVAYVVLLTLAVGAGVMLQLRAATGATDAERMWVAFLLLGCTLVVAGSIVVTQSRGGWFAVAVGLVALAFFIGLPRGWRWLGLPVAGALAVAGTLVFYGGVGWLPRLVGNMTGKAGFRQELWTAGISALQDWRWTGMGFNFFRSEARLNYPFAMNVLVAQPSTDVGRFTSAQLVAECGRGPGCAGHDRVCCAVAAAWRRPGAGGPAASRLGGPCGLGAAGRQRRTAGVWVVRFSAAGQQAGIIIWPMLVLGQLLGAGREAKPRSAPA
ncbi:hypothetical protein EMGBS3_02720 [Anaerolineaceae bacterium]|nr:hypothetical protein EMGBS3_02720 [Anaerolineaceae bacterium]